MREISIDIETYSPVDISSAGVYKYSEHPDAKLLLFSYSVDGGDVITIDVAQGEEIPVEILKALTDPSVLKFAYNCNFERTFLAIWVHRNYSEYFKSYSTKDDTVSNYFDPTSWRCDMVWAGYLALPLSLEACGAVLNLEQQKMKEGKALIKLFCVPNKKGFRTLPSEAPEQWELFKEYNKMDVIVENAIHSRLSNFPLPETTWHEYEVDQMINDRGVLIDMELVNNAINIDTITRGRLVATMKEKTSLDNPNSVRQMREWLATRGINTDSLDKKAIKTLLETVPTDVADVLRLRQQLSKSSIKKYITMREAVCADGRCRGLYQFMGTHTHRWAGRLLQTQNLPHTDIQDLDEARTMVKNGDIESLQMLYDNIPDTLSQLIRTCFIVRNGYSLYVADYSSIEGRVNAYLAGEKWVLDCFHEGRDLYCACVEQMFNIPCEKNGVNADKRKYGKICTLALQYGGGSSALLAFNALDLGIEEDELDGLVQRWRNANPATVAMWRAVDNAARKAVKEKTTTMTHGLKFIYQSATLFIELPDKRRLAYARPRICENRFGGESISYECVGTNKKWVRNEIWGARLCENIIQSYARGILADSLVRLKDFYVIGHIHDEILLCAPNNYNLDDLCDIMGTAPEWAPGLELRADGFVSQYYKKE